ncbi:MAG: hypothetical protein F4220_18305 [Gammaproteobacteria bacterium]|nr:hypothetical protein [Gammaproteobacteria bacterium]
MNDSNPFWNLSDLKEISNQAELFDVLEQGDSLKGLSFRRQALAGEEWQRIEIRDKQFVDCQFSQTRFVGITFRNCTFEGCLFIGSIFKACNFHRCNFKSTNTHKISIEKTYIDPLSFDACLDKNSHQNIGTHLFHELLKNSRDEGQPEFERDANFLYLRWKRYQDWYEIGQKRKRIVKKRTLDLCVLGEVTKASLSCWVRCFWEVSAGSGLRIGRFGLSATIAALVFSVINCVYRVELGLERDDEPIAGYWEALYFTIISLTTLGYGDIAPTTTVGQLLASFQSIVGFILFAALASMLFRRFFP